MKSLTRYLAEGLLKTAGSAVYSLASSAAEDVSKSLLTMMGFYSEKDLKTDQLKAWAKSVTDELNLVNGKLETLSKQIDSGFTAVTAGGIYQAYQNQYNATVKERGFIADRYKELINILSKTYKNKEDLEQKIANLENSAGTRLLDDIHTVARFWGADSFSKSRNVLENFTDACIVSAEYNIDNLMINYLDLEYNFEFCIYTLYQGYAVWVTLKNYKTRKKADVETLRAFTDEVKSFIQPITDSFNACTERLILSTYHPDINPKPKDYITLAPTKVMKEIGERMNLRVFQAVNLTSAIKGPGIIIKEYLRPSKTIGKVPQVNIKYYGGKDEKLVSVIDGVTWQPPAKYVSGPVMKNWYKVVDKNSNGELMPFEDSDVIVTIYTEPYDEQRAMAVRFFGYYFATSMQLGEDEYYNEYFNYIYYDEDTLERVEGAGASGTIPLGYGIFDDHLRDFNKEPYWGLKEVEHDKLVFKFNVENEEMMTSNGYCKSLTTHGAVKGEPPSMVGVNAKFSAEAAKFNTLKKFNTTYLTVYPIIYAKTTLAGRTTASLTGEKGNNRLMLLNEAMLTIHVDDYKSDMVHARACDIEINIFASINQKKTNYFGHKYEQNTKFEKRPINYLNSDNKFYSSDNKIIEKDRLGIPLEAGQTTEITWAATFVVQTQDMGIPFISKIIDNNVIGEVWMYPRIAWQQPSPVF